MFTLLRTTYFENGYPKSTVEGFSYGKLSHWEDEREPSSAFQTLLAGENRCDCNAPELLRLPPCGLCLDPVCLLYGKSPIVYALHEGNETH
jgi:hypothetical protein